MADSTVFPAHAGMIPGRNQRRLPWSRVPRACGDDPRVAETCSLVNGCSPRMRG